MDLGRPISYEVLERGTPVYSSDGERIGNVIHVLADEREDVFDGIVIAEQRERIPEREHRFADADEIHRIYEHGVVLALDRGACRRLPTPSANPAVLRADPAETAADRRRARLARAWDLISGRV